MATQTAGTSRARRRVLPLLIGCLALLITASCATASRTPGPGAASAGTAVGPAEVTADTRTSPLPPGTPGRGRPAIVVGTKDFAEQFLLGELYTQALRAKGYTVTLQQNVGGSEIIDAAFAANRIQMYPEYLGEIASGPAKDTANDPLGVYQAALRFEQTQRGATILRQTPYQNIDVMVVRQQDASRYGLATVADLARVGSGGDGVRIAAQPPFRTRFSGLQGLQQVYGLTGAQLLAVAPDETYQALDAGQVDVADGFSTDPALTSGRYVTLDDPQHIFGFQYVAPVVKQANLDQLGPEFAQTCNWVSSLLTVDAIRDMNRQVQVDGADEARVAGTFLASHGLA